MSEPFIWSSKEGYDLVRRIVEPTPLPYVPHDDQLEGVCKSLDGVHLFAITPTGSGKTGYYIIYMLVVLAVVADPSLCPTAKFPSNPCLLVMSDDPVAARNERCNKSQAANTKMLGLKVLAINAQTRSDSLRRDNVELWVTARKTPNIILTGPKQLTRPESEKAIRGKEFLLAFVEQASTKFIC
ncbi:hypothetical protein B0H13DRAFT_1872774 [Mycena leptocephala]|nr:hypothetical protein B0H13DRAFT_1872774 [Mycena leptocephala]